LLLPRGAGVRGALLLDAPEAAAAKGMGDGDGDEEPAEAAAAAAAPAGPDTAEGGSTKGAVEKGSAGSCCWLPPPVAPRDLGVEADTPLPLRTVRGVCIGGRSPAAVPLLCLLGRGDARGDASTAPPPLPLAPVGDEAGELRRARGPVDTGGVCNGAGRMPLRRERDEVGGDSVCAPAPPLPDPAAPVTELARRERSAPSPRTGAGLLDGAAAAPCPSPAAPAADPAAPGAGEAAFCCCGSAAFVSPVVVNGTSTSAKGTSLLRARSAGAGKLSTRTNTARSSGITCMTCVGGKGTKRCSEGGDTPPPSDEEGEEAGLAAAVAGEGEMPPPTIIVGDAIPAVGVVALLPLASGLSSSGLSEGKGSGGSTSSHAALPIPLRCCSSHRNNSEMFRDQSASSRANSCSREWETPSARDNALKDSIQSRGAGGCNAPVEIEGPPFASVPAAVVASLPLPPLDDEAAPELVVAACVSASAVASAMAMGTTMSDPESPPSLNGARPAPAPSQQRGGCSRSYSGLTMPILPALTPCTDEYAACGGGGSADATLPFARAPPLRTDLRQNLE